MAEQLRPRMNIVTPVKRFDMNVEGVATDLQSTGDFLFTSALDRSQKDLPLASGQLGWCGLLINVFASIPSLSRDARRVTI
jgi:hypothetical protein